MGLLVDLSPSIKRLHNPGLARGGVGDSRPPDMAVYQCGYTVCQVYIKYTIMDILCIKYISSI